MTEMLAVVSGVSFVAIVLLFAKLEVTQNDESN